MEPGDFVQVYHKNGWHPGKLVTMGRKNATVLLNGKTRNTHVLASSVKPLTKPPKATTLLTIDDNVSAAPAAPAAPSGNILTLSSGRTVHEPSGEAKLVEEDWAPGSLMLRVNNKTVAIIPRAYKRLAEVMLNAVSKEVSLGIKKSGSGNSA